MGERIGMEEHHEVVVLRQDVPRRWRQDLLTIVLDEFEQGGRGRVVELVHRRGIVERRRIERRRPVTLDEHRAVARDDIERLLGRRRLAELSGLDETAIWEWGVVERMSTGLLGVMDGFTEGPAMLAAADAIAASAD